MLLLKEKRDLDVWRHSLCSFNWRKLDILAASGIRNPRIAQEESWDLMIFLSVEKDRAWLCWTTRRGYRWTQGLFFTPVELAATCQEQKSSTTAPVRVGCELGFFSFLAVLSIPTRLDGCGSCFAIHHPKNTIAGNRKKNFLSSFFLNI